MTFRDDIDAAYARLEVLEGENRKLVEDNAKLRGIPLPARVPIPEDHDAVLGRIEDLEHSNRHLTAENERIRTGGAPPPAPEPPHKPWPGQGGDLPEVKPEAVAFIFIAFVIVAGIVKLLAG